MIISPNFLNSIAQSYKITEDSQKSILSENKNYFFEFLRVNYKSEYEKLVKFDKLIGEMQPHTAIKSKIFISRSRKRIDDLLPEECNDAEFFDYLEAQILALGGNADEN